MTVEAPAPPPPLIVVMGVSGCGKSTIGAALADKLGIDFIDGDRLHPQTNVQKMSHGIALNDSDRLPWLADIGRTLRDYRDSGLVLACSALKRIYRDAIRWEVPNVIFVHATGDADLIAQRQSSRHGHFMPASLLESQLSTLQALSPDEIGFEVDIRDAVTAIVAQIFEQLPRIEHLAGER
ncbi:gluconokinase [Paramicrobacterium chengjingii]|nr:gluconokinase [Microbacterium chengjingii]